LSWAREWNVSPRPEHGGILIVPGQWTIQRTVSEIDRFVQSERVLTNSLYLWEDQPTWSDWVRQPDPP
jgi:hypothetical protein